VIGSSSPEGASGGGAPSIADAVRPEAPPQPEGWGGPGSEAERIVRRASGGRLAIKMALVVVAVGAAGAGVYFGLDAYREREARHAPMAKIPPASVQIGAPHGPPEERPVHAVSIAAFEIDVTEVTVGAYAVCVKRGRCTPPVKGDFCNWGQSGVDEHPINCVDWTQAKAYCAWVGKRLPTEKEWEYAARGSDGRRFPWGADPPGPKLLNVCGAECRLYGAKRGRVWNAMYDYDDGWPLTAPVGSYPAGDGPFGLKDMAGNVWEWTASPYCPYPVEECGNSQEYVIRGGGWTNQYAMNMEVTTRNAVGRTEAVEALGFRCCRSRESRVESRE